MIAQLVHVWVVLCHDRDGVTLLPNDQACLLLGGITQVYPIILRKITEKVTKQLHLKSLSVRSKSLQIIDNFCIFYITDLK